MENQMMVHKEQAFRRDSHVEAPDTIIYINQKIF